MLKRPRGKSTSIDISFCESKRENTDYIQISVLFEVFLCRLFGERYYLYVHHGRIRETKWKQIIKRIADTIEKAIEKNINTDGFQKSQLCLYIDKLKRASKSSYTIDIDIIHSLTGIIFELLGGMPNYSQRKTINRADDYVLRKLRTLQYYQSPSQKIQTILEASKFEPFCNYHKYNDLFDVYCTNYNGDPKGFIDWYKNKYPQVYLKIF